MTSRAIKDIRLLLEQYQAKLPYVYAGVFCFLIFCISKCQDNRTTHIYHNDNKATFKDARVLGKSNDLVVEGKEALLSKTVRDLLASQTNLQQNIEQVKQKLDDFEKNRAPSATSSIATSTAAEAPKEPPSDVKVHAPSEEFEIGLSQTSSLGISGRTSIGGSSIISFPVKEVPADGLLSVVIPPGSYVKAKLMTGVAAPEGKTYPVLLQLDYAFIIPNKKKLDLSGCFMIAKSQGDLSTERVQMQASKLSCVGKDGKMFEREVSGFVADDKDNSFAVSGTVVSKQDRVAAMAFLSSIVEGVGKAIQQAQTTQQTNALGGSQSIITGDQGAYLAAGGASNAASLVTQWYLKQAQNLLPTIHVVSGQDVWIVMQDTVKLPNQYFKKNDKGGNTGAFSYFSRLVD